MQPARTIDEVVERLEGIIRWSMEAQSRLGFFAALYNRVTREVRDGIAAKKFEDNERMARLDVLFANRYLDAFDRYQAGQPPTRSWLASFEAARLPNFAPLVHLLLGMTAHIYLDLGIAGARVAAGDSIHSLERDFNSINGVLLSLVDRVKQENVGLQPVLHPLVLAAGGMADRAVGVMMDAARAQAWSFAVELAPLGQEDQEQRIARRDLETTVISAGLLEANALSAGLELGAYATVADQIAALAEGELGPSR